MLEVNEIENFERKGLKLNLFPGDYEAFNHLLLDGYDHIIDVTDPEGVGIIHITRSRGYTELANFMETFRDFEVIFEFI